MNSDDVGSAVCEDRIDAFFWLVGHPSRVTDDVLGECDTRLVNVEGNAVDDLVAEKSFYRKARIPAGMYNNTTDINTFGVDATLVSSREVSADIIYLLVAAVFENFETFRTLHPALSELEPSVMIKDSLTAPLHEGAIRHYRERGWM